MEPQNQNPNHPIPANFTATNTSFPVQLSAVAASVNSGQNVSSPFLMSTLRQLSSAGMPMPSAAAPGTTASSGFLSSTSQFSLPTQFPTMQPLQPDLYTIPWNTAAAQSAAWFDQAKMASMFPSMYGMLQSAASSNNDRLQSNMLQNNVSANLEQAAAAVFSAINFPATFSAATANKNFWPQPTLNMNPRISSLENQPIFPFDIDPYSQQFQITAQKDLAASLPMQQHVNASTPATLNPPTANTVVQTPKTCTHSSTPNNPSEILNIQSPIGPNFFVYQMPYLHDKHPDTFQQHDNSIPMSRIPKQNSHSSSHMKMIKVTKQTTFIPPVQSTQTCLTMPSTSNDRPTMSAMNNTNNTVDELSTLDLHDLEELLMDKRHHGEAFDPARHLPSGSLFGDDDKIVVDDHDLGMPSTSTSVPSSMPITLPPPRTPSPKPAKTEPLAMPAFCSSKVREKIQERRAEELADADKELDRLVSLVARRNDFGSSSVLGVGAKAPLLTFGVDSFKMTSPKMPSTFDSPENISLGPAQFTPPDSPTNQSEEASNPSICPFPLNSSKPYGEGKLGSSTNKFNPTSVTNDLDDQKPSTSANVQSSQYKPEIPMPKLVDKNASKSSLVFIPKPSHIGSVSKSDQKNMSQLTKASGARRIENKVPIYKQKTNNNATTSFFKKVLEIAKAQKETALESASITTIKAEPSEDAYNFEDDETDGRLNLPSTSIVMHQQPSTSSTLRTRNRNDSSDSPRNSLESTGPGAEKKNTFRKRQSTRKTSAQTIPVDKASPTVEGQQNANRNTSSSTIAECIRKRRQLNHLPFLQTEVLANDDQTVPGVEVQVLEQQCDGTAMDNIPVCVIKEETSETNFGEERNTNGDCPRPLPKLVIRLGVRRETARNSVEEEESGREGSKEKKKKKKKKREKDREWRASGDDEQLHKHHHSRHNKDKDKKHGKHSKRRHSSNSFDIPETTAQNTQTFSTDCDEVARKKQWLKEECNGAGERQLSDRAPSSAFDEQPTENMENIRLKAASDEMLERLRYFAKANGNLRKGTFVVLKDEALRPECPLWKIDNQNLLQKYPMMCEWDGDSTICYKNSSTYAGWCDQLAEDYMVVEVTFLKHSRSECIVRPMVPIQDLFPAIATQLPSEETSQSTASNASTQKFQEEISWNIKDMNRIHLRTYVQALLKHSISLDFLQTVKASNDWNYLCALNEVEKQNGDCIERCIEKLKSPEKWTDSFSNGIHKYANIHIVAETVDGHELCQACSGSGANSVVQLFTDQIYDPETLVSENMHNAGAGSPLLAIDFRVCKQCELVAQTYHKLYHLRFHTFKRCEGKVESVTVQNPEMSSESVITECLKDKEWFQNIVNEHLELWKRAK